MAYEKRKERLGIADGIYYVGGVDRRLRIEFWRSFVCIEQITQGTCFTCVLLGHTFDENKRKKCLVYCECQ